MADPDIGPDAVARFTRLYDQYYGNVHGYAASMAGRQLAEEVASETFLVAWRRLDDLPDPALPWLLGVARSVVRTQYRQAAREDSVIAELQNSARQTTADVADRVVERTAARQALARLSTGDREILTLVAWHGLSTAQAAKVVGCSPAAYLVRLHRARRRFRQAVDGDDLAGDLSAGMDVPALST